LEHRETLSQVAGLQDQLSLGSHESVRILASSIEATIKAHMCGTDVTFADFLNHLQVERGCDGWSGVFTG
jgi:hypothetical protein